MSMWRKKPVVIEAVRFDPMFEHHINLPEGVIGVPRWGADNWGYDGCEFYINTLEGAMKVVQGDWIIKGVKGEFYPCKPDIFEMTYERVDEAIAVEMTDEQTLQTRVKDLKRECDRLYNLLNKSAEDIDTLEEALNDICDLTKEPAVIERIEKALEMVFHDYQPNEYDKYMEDE